MHALRLLASVIAITSAVTAAPLVFFAQGGTSASGDAKNARDNFIAALGGGLVMVGENFETVGPVYNTPNVSGQLSYVTPLGKYEATTAGAGGLLLQIRESSGDIQGRYNVEPGGGDRWLDSNDLGQFVLTLNAPTYAFGTWITDMGDVSGEFSFTFGSDNRPLTLTTRADGNLGFFGYISDTPFTKIKFDVDNLENDGWGFDGIETYRNSQVPEPATYAMMGAGLAALALLRRRS